MLSLYYIRWVFYSAFPLWFGCPFFFFSSFLVGSQCNKNKFDNHFFYIICSVLMSRSADLFCLFLYLCYGSCEFVPILWIHFMCTIYLFSHLLQIFASQQSYSDFTFGFFFFCNVVYIHRNVVPTCGLTVKCSL